MEMVEPWGDRRLDLLFARLTAFIANVVRDDKKYPDPFTAADFMPDWQGVWKAAREEVESEEEAKEKTEELVSKAMALNTWFGGKVN